MEKLVENTLGPPGAWEVALPAGKGKRENLKRLLPHRPAIGAGLNGSMQHQLEVYLQGSQQLKVVRER